MKVCCVWNDRCGLPPSPPGMKMCAERRRAIRESPLREGIIFRGIAHAGRVCTTSNENVRAAEEGNHKGCPYSGFVGAYFQRSISCGLPPSPHGMKRALVPPFFEGLMARDRGWIPASAGMTVGIAAMVIFREMDCRSTLRQAQGKRRDEDGAPSLRRRPVGVLVEARTPRPMRGSRPPCRQAFRRTAPSNCRRTRPGSLQS